MIKRGNRVVFDSAALKLAQDSLGFDSASEMARVINTPLRTYQDWLAGRSRIPGVVEVAVTLLQDRVNWSMEKIKASLDDRARRDFPKGINTNGN